MATLDMNGPYTLDITTIDQVVTDISPGNYALGEVKDDKFYVHYVGRSDRDLAQRLTDWVGDISSTHFMFSYSSSPEDAFKKECRNYHDFTPPKNDRHPQRPDGTNWKCPACNVFG